MLKPNTFNIWLKYYILDNKIDTTELIINEVIDNNYIKFNIHDLFNLCEDYPELQKHVRSIASKAVYTNTSPIPEYKKLILFNLKHTGKEFKQRIIGG